MVLASHYRVLHLTCSLRLCVAALLLLEGSASSSVQTECARQNAAVHNSGDCDQGSSWNDVPGQEVVTRLQWILKEGQEVELGKDGELAVDFRVWGLQPGDRILVYQNESNAGTIQIDLGLPREFANSGSAYFQSLAPGESTLSARVIRGSELVPTADTGEVTITLTPRKAHVESVENLKALCNSSALTAPWPLLCPELRPNVGFPPTSSWTPDRRPLVVASWVKWFDAQTFDERDVAECPVPCTFLHLPSSAHQKCLDQVSAFSCACHHPLTRNVLIKYLYSPAPSIFRSLGLFQSGQSSVLRSYLLLQRHSVLTDRFLSSRLGRLFYAKRLQCLGVGAFFSGRL